MLLLTTVATFLALPVGLIIWSAQTLATNRAKARATGLPYLIRYVSPMNSIWLFYGSSIIRLCQRLGITSENFTCIYSHGWEANERAQIFVDYGDAFLVVHPAGMQLCVTDAKTIYDVLTRKREFRRNMEEMAVLDVYGRNLSTVDDAEWQAHRKMTTVTVTEKNNELVWEQSLAQAKPVRSTHLDTKNFTLNVLAAAMFNEVYPFEGQEIEKPDAHKNDKSYQYRECLSTILSSIIQIFVFGEEVLKAWWTPRLFKNAARAMDGFRSYIFGLMNKEKEHLARGDFENRHLVARLVKAREESEELDTDITITDQTSDRGRKMTLTKKEILSNLFVYTFAGNDTTAIVLTSLLIHLAANPDTQDWVSEEINYYLPTGASVESCKYETYFQLKRCRAVVEIPLKVNGQTYVLPPHTTAHCSIPALHAYPKYWGSNPLAWNPSRFISMSSTSTPTKSPNTQDFDQEKVEGDTSDHFMPFAWGQRVCPGKKFAQVELVAVLAALFKDWKVEVVPKDGETCEQARERAWKSSLVVDHERHMLHEMFDPKSVGLKWAGR
ncbi:putative cytochrome p450 monooxygenase protein [Botrytis fragariae]|uniref:Putative cytochrome p450 monooxygenase protein n=1 Tax=Botrytis fragariae TaxID=1964551 RepID=A0A8H6AKE9_9HELO|nr:putative cytochrome p450 monooxygenase protein [Botrytis fragariae]KAF5869348.1 putative cytochrome p450 monooxygenase protein [Botrytis fragariae]